MHLRRGGVRAGKWSRAVNLKDWNRVVNFKEWSRFVNFTETSGGGLNVSGLL
jgi:hypothetical protein